MMRKVLKKNISLIEASIGIAILALIAGGVVQICSQTLARLEESRNQAIAFNLAKAKIEELSRKTVSPADSGSETYTSIGGFPNFRRTWNVVWALYDINGDLIPDTLTNELAQITVTIYWNNDAESRAFTTLKARY